MKVVSYSDIGLRLNNEDYIALGEFAFVLCDGVGGIDKGEVASRQIACSLIDKLNSTEPAQITIKTVENLIAEVQLDLNALARETPDLVGIGTTLCVAVFLNNTLICAHIGDSRIYVIDTQRKKYWKTTDHSISCELVKSGLIKESEAKRHPMSNHLTRAIQALPQNQPQIPDIQTFKNINSQHLIFICSDGVTEVMDDKMLTEILSNSNLSIEDRFEEIKRRCTKEAKDNHSAILIQPDSEDGLIEESPETENIWIPIFEKSGIVNDDDQHLTRNMPDKTRKIMMYLIVLLATTAIAIILFSI